MSGSVAGFFYKDHVLTCDGVSLASVARGCGTPTHVYSAALLAERYRQFEAPFAGIPHQIHYAMKANATLGIVARLRELGAWADANSGGEIEVALRAGFSPREIVFTGVGKTPAELDRAVSLGLGAISVESVGELNRIAAIAQTSGKTARVAVRINPDIDAGSHPHISTGSRMTKFGVTLDEARAMIRTVRERSSLHLVGIHLHIGSQLTKVEPITRAAEAFASFARELTDDGVKLEHIDLGGGLGIPYERDQQVLSPEAYAAAILPAIASTGLKLVLEPGRWIVGPTGVILTEVVDIKNRADGGQFVVVDAGMTDLMRPALYAAYHEIEPVVPRPGAARVVDVVGPVCETTDTLAAGRSLPPLEVGDLLAIRDTGAYGSVMASNYNGRPLAAEVIIDNHEPRILRRRQTIDEMLQRESR